MPNPVIYFEVESADVKKAQKFYADLFGWHIDANNPMNYGIVDTHTEGKNINGGITVPQAVLEDEDEERRGGGVILYVEVDDIEAYLRKAEGLGAKTVLPRTVVPDIVTMALFADTDGNTIGLIEAGST